MNGQQARNNRRNESIHNRTREGEKICMSQTQAFWELQQKETGRILIFDTVHITREFVEQCRAKGIAIEFIH